MKNELGQKGEAFVFSYLQRQGYEILETNYRNRMGEIDIIAKEGEVWCFIEVKTRSSDLYGGGLEAITPYKQKHMIRVALSYLTERDLLDEYSRFDVVAVSGNPDEAPTVEIIKNAFELTENRW